MAEQDGDNDDFQSIPKKSTGKKKIYVGNLPVCMQNDELEGKLIQLFRERAHSDIVRADIHVNSTKTCHAVVSCAGNLDEIIQNLNRTSFEGRRLVVQRERKRKDHGSANKSFFGGPSWSKANQSSDRGDSEKPDPREDQIQQVLAEEMKNSNDPVGTAIISVAAIGIVSSVLPQEDEGAEGEKNGVSSSDFLSLCQQPVSGLLAGYGEQDLNFDKVQPSVVENSKTQAAEKIQDESRLGQHGKAPIHIDFCSFGYYHGAPAELRNGWSHAQPLRPFDCRDLEPVPHYLAWEDGLSGGVKRALMSSRLRRMADEMAKQTAESVVEAVDEGGHGYALPLRMIVYVGSESGRHRSVVLCELAATALRNFLRSNDGGNRFKQPCSVGTQHRDLERRNAKAHNSSSKAKQRDLEDD
jgi:RNA recognition motif-containing protein